jgi:hypothetical protein
LDNQERKNNTQRPKKEEQQVRSRQQRGVTLRYWHLPLLCFHEQRLYADYIRETKEVSVSSHACQKHIRVPAN